MSDKKEKVKLYTEKEVVKLINDACIFMVGHAMELLASPVDDKPEMHITMNNWIKENLG